MTADIHPAALDPQQLLVQCNQRFTRRSGPGGQNRNKVETAVILTHRPTGLIAEANERRSQGENREQALFRLRLLIALEVRHPIKNSPTYLWQTRCRGGKLFVNRAHGDFPSLLAEVLDVVVAKDDDAKIAAEFFKCSTTQLLKFLRDEPRALIAINARRSQRSLHLFR